MFTCNKLNISCYLHGITTFLGTNRFGSYRFFLEIKSNENQYNTFNSLVIQISSLSTCAPLRRNLDVFVVAMLFIVILDARDSLEPARDMRVFFDNGDSETFAIGTKTPNFGAHSKYLLGRNVWL